MAWDDAPPTKEELKWDELPPSKEKKSKAWDEEPPSAEELNQEISATEGLTREFVDALPIAAGTVGGLLGAPLAPPWGGIAGAGLLGAAGESAKTYLKDVLYNEKKPVVENLKDIAKTGAETASGEMGILALAKGAASIPKIPSVSNWLKEGAGKLAENATGATGLQASKFKPGAGKELLNRGLVKFGDTAENIAIRTQQAMDDSVQAIDSSLQKLDDAGVKISNDHLVNAIEARIGELKRDPSQAPVAKKLKKIVEDIRATGANDFLISEAEQTKRGYNKMAGNWMKPNTGAAGKEAYLTYMKAVEDAAQAADPATAQLFKESKQTYGLLAPIEEAASRRAAVLNQSPFGGLGDMAAAGVGGAVGGGAPGAFGGVLAKNLISPRIASSSAVAADKMSKIVGSIPGLQELIIKNPAVAQTIINRLSPLEKTDTVPIAPQMPKTPQQIKADKSLTNTQKARAMNESSRIRSLMPPGQ